MIILENKLIVYKPKKNIKKIILIIFLALFLSILIFVAATLSSALISIKSKWNNYNYENLQTIKITEQPTNN